MDARELQKLWHELLDKNPSFEQFARNLSFVVSYLISEQDKRKELARQIQEHKEAMNEANEQRAKISLRVEQLYERSEKNGKLLRALVTTVLSGVVLELLRIAFNHKP